MSSTPSAKTAVPFVYRLILLTIEPLFAVMGSILVFTDPSTYAGSVTRHAVKFTPDTAFLYTGLGGAWLYFAFMEAVVLRLVDDLFLWRVLCFGMLLSDVAFLHSMAQAVGGWAVYSSLAEWTAEDWVGMAATAPMVLTRILIVLGIGLRSDNKGRLSGKAE
ncbi:unnamed protein product [Discula destructiva]